MADPYRTYDEGVRPAPAPLSPALTCSTYLGAMVAGGFVAPAVAFLYNLYAEQQAGTTLGMLLGFFGWTIPADFVIYLVIAGLGLGIGPLVLALVHGIFELRRRT